MSGTSAEGSQPRISKPRPGADSLNRWDTIATRLHQPRLCSNDTEQMLDPTTRVLRYVNAGHNPQYVLRRDGGLERMHATGLPVGLLAGRGYREQTLQLAAGDQLFFYTDGCIEMENERGDMFGTEGLESLLVEAANSPNPLHRIEDAIAKFRGSSEPLDDATLMTVKVG